MTDMIEKNETLVQESETKKKKSGKGKKIAIIVSSILVACIAFFAVWHLVIVPSNKYKNAMKLIDTGNTQEAYAILTELGDFRDARQLLENFKWVVSKDENPDGFIRSTEYSYDLQGNCIKKVEISKNGTQDITEYIYDGEGKCTKKVQTDSYGSTTAFDYIYDEQGRLVKQVHGTYVFANYTYDEQGNCIKESGWEWSSNYIYDEQGKCVREEHYGEGYRDIIDYTYDEQGKVIKKVSNDGMYEDSITVTEYFYDENGNCNIETVKSDNSNDEIIVKHEYQFIYAAKE